MFNCGQVRGCATVQVERSAHWIPAFAGMTMGRWNDGSVE
jgi:uncharacterized protein YgiB involved in biofilm formation